MTFGFQFHNNKININFIEFLSFKFERRTLKRWETHLLKYSTAEEPWDKVFYINIVKSLGFLKTNFRKFIF